MPSHAGSGSTSRGEGQAVWQELANGNVDQGVASGCSVVHRSNNGFQRTADQAPAAVAENYDRELAALQLLLKTQVFVSGEEHVESGFFRNLQELTVGQRVPSLGLGFLDGVPLQRTSNSSGRAVIKQDEHLGADGSFQAARSEIEHGVDLLAGYVEPPAP